MQLIGSAARVCPMSPATFVVFSTPADWLAARRINFVMASAVWNIPTVRVATLASIALIFLSYSLTGERGGWR
jgi:hypothetical protein